MNGSVCLGVNVGSMLLSFLLCWQKSIVFVLMLALLFVGSLLLLLVLLLKNSIGFGGML